MLIKNYQKMFNIKKIVINFVFLLILPLSLTLIAFQQFFTTRSNFIEEPVIKGSQQVMALNTKNTLTPVVKVGLDLSANFQDYRAYVLDKYFALNRSPLSGFGSDFIEACDKYKAPSDCTTIPAIAYVETGLCTLGISQAQFNCWGWGGSGENRILFKSYPEAIDSITKGMVNGYGKIMQQPDKIVTTYCGPHCNNWAEGVTTQRNKINNMSKQLNLPALF